MPPNFIILEFWKYGKKESKNIFFLNAKVYNLYTV